MLFAAHFDIWHLSHNSSTSDNSCINICNVYKIERKLPLEHWKRRRYRYKKIVLTEISRENVTRLKYQAWTLVFIRRGGREREGVGWFCFQIRRVERESAQKFLGRF